MIIIKWNGKMLEVDLCLKETVLTLKTKLFDLIEIEIERQKLIYKGKLLLNEEILSNLDLKNNFILLLGSKKIIQKRILKEEIVTENFIKSKTKSETKPTPLINLGNTCYMNAVIQILYSIPELFTELKIASKEECNSSLVYELKLLFEEMKNSQSKAFAPFSFLSELQKTFKQFNEKDLSGYFSQQDSIEFWDGIINLLEKTKNRKKVSFIEGLFKGVIEGEKEIKELFFSITNETKCIEDCIKNELGQTKFIICPKYLVLKVGRFYWKKEEKTNAKILKKILFPIQLSLPSTEEQKEYSLVSILTHKGRSTSSGHYISWVRDKENENDWWMLDDQNVSICTQKEIIKLSGGGDWHLSYLMIYKKKRKETV